MPESRALRSVSTSFRTPVANPRPITFSPETQQLTPSSCDLATVPGSPEPEDQRGQRSRASAHWTWREPFSASQVKDHVAMAFSKAAGMRERGSPE